MMVLKDYYYLCSDCMIAAVNDDYSGLDEDRYQEVKEGIEALPPNTVPAGTVGDEDRGLPEQEFFDQGFMHQPCDCCAAPAGNRYLFAVLEEVKHEAA